MSTQTAPITSRYVVISSSDQPSPTGFSKGDAPTMLRKLADLFGRFAQGASASNLQIAYKPVSALATVTTTHTGSETSGDTLTVGGIAITFETSGALGASKQVNIASGSAGTSTSGSTPATTTGGVFQQMYVNINGDGPQAVGTSATTGSTIASTLQTAIRALTANNPLNAAAFSAATVTYGSTYVITSGTKGRLSSVVVSASPNSAQTAAGAPTTLAGILKLGVYNGGAEAVGTYTTNDGIVALINGQTLAAGFTLSTAAFNGICTAYACGDVLTLTAGLPGTMGNGLALAVSSTGSVMALTHVWGAATAGTEGTSATFKSGL